MADGLLNSQSFLWIDHKDPRNEVFGHRAHITLTETWILQTADVFIDSFLVLLLNLLLILLVLGFLSNG